MAIIDSQVHAYEANTPKRPWATVPNWPPHVTGDEMVAAMDQVGVDGAIFISSFSMYRYDGSYAEEVARQHPGRMAIVKPVDPDDKNVADVIAKWKKTQGAVGIRIFLREACGFVLEALGKPSSNVPFMMPKRVADTDPNKQIDDYTGSGPFIFKKDEWKPGEKIVYVKNAAYKPRAEAPSMLAGAKIAKVDRVEWLAIPDPATAANALLAGEIDYIEAPPHDLKPLLLADKRVTLQVYNTIGAQYAFRWNTVVPPFDNEKVRRAAMYAFDQASFLEGVIGDKAYYRTFDAMFVCGTPLENSAGMDGLVRGNFARSKELLKEAGYDGTPIVMLHTTDIAVLTNAGPIAKDLLEKGGFKVEMVPLDFQAIVSRRLRKTSANDGGWNGFMTAWLSVDMMNPLTNSMLTASCDKANFGWPCDAEVERLRDAFARARRERDGFERRLDHTRVGRGRIDAEGDIGQQVGLADDQCMTGAKGLWVFGRFVIAFGRAE